MFPIPELPFAGFSTDTSESPPFTSSMPFVFGAWLTLLTTSFLSENLSSPLSLTRSSLMTCSFFATTSSALMFSFSILVSFAFLDIFLFTLPISFPFFSVSDGVSIFLTVISSDLETVTVLSGFNDTPDFFEVCLSFGFSFFSWDSEEISEVFDFSFLIGILFVFFLFGRLPLLPRCLLVDPGFLLIASDVDFLLTASTVAFSLAASAVNFLLAAPAVDFLLTAFVRFLVTDFPTFFGPVDVIDATRSVFLSCCFTPIFGFGIIGSSSEESDTEESDSTSI
mmetsp:Transcript_26573/g.64238  ORF Transcript_26573/g.64238 Transcript_26573/m.64238 type:complete len:281 (+) Transcript_26573:1780-2622(+)